MKTRSFSAAVLTLAISAAFAQTPPTPTQLPGVRVTGQAMAPLADYLKLPQYANPNLSPDGRFLLVSVPVNGRLNLAVVDMQTRKGTAITNFRDLDVIETHWVGSERIVFSLGQANSPTGPGQFDGGGLFVVSKDGGDARQLAPLVRESRARNQIHRQIDFLRTIPGNTNEILVTANLRSQDAEDVYRMDLRNGRTTLITSERPAYANDWILDNKGVPRVVRSWVKDTYISPIFYRAAEGAPWVEIARIDRLKGEAIVPLGFMADNKTLMVAANPGRDTMAVYTFDPETRRLGELLAQHERFDMGADVSGNSVPGVITQPETDKLIGYVVNADRPITAWADEKEARTQATVDRALPGMRNTFRRFPDSSRLLITSYSDVQPQTFYILDEDKRTLEELFVSRPWLTKERLVEMRPFLLKTRDGLEIPSYYFLPKGTKVGDKLPTVVHIHGGPAVRADSWARGFGYLEAQVLASRGYAVILPNFRITPGFGAKIYRSGFGTIGRQMSEDHEDAVKWAIDQGIADPNRICISGASYGGYAVLRALAKTPDMFKCGVAGLVVSDLEMQITSTAGDMAYSPAAVEFWHSIIGKDASGRTAFAENSPVNMADRIKAPVFMYAGADDIRTPLEQTNAMARALSRAGNPPKTVMIKKEEGHGFGRLENNVDLYTEMLKFLEQSIGPGR